MDRRDVFVPSGCSKHPGELLQHFCRSCFELLCFRCILTTGGTHRDHEVIDYKIYLRERERQAIKLLRQFNEIRARAEHFNTLLASYKADFIESHKESEGNLESFKTVKKEMQKWQQDLSRGLEEKKLLQLKFLDEAIEAANRGEINDKPVTIHLPKVTIHIQLRFKLQEKVQELVPKSFSSFIRVGGSADVIRKNVISRSSRSERESFLDSLRRQDRSSSPTLSELTISDSTYECISDGGSILSDSTTITDTLKIGASAYSLTPSSAKRSSENQPLSSYDSLQSLSITEVDPGRQDRPKLTTPPSTRNVTSPFEEINDQPEPSDTKPIEMEEDPPSRQEESFSLAGEEHTDQAPAEDDNTAIETIPQESVYSESPPPIPPRYSPEDPEEGEVYIEVGTQSVISPPLVTEPYTLAHRKLHSSPAVSPIIEHIQHSLTLNDDIYDVVALDIKEVVPLYDALGYESRTNTAAMTVSPTHSNTDNNEYDVPYELIHPSYQQLDQTDIRPAPYATPSMSCLPPPPVPPPREIIIPPSNIILASCFSDSIYGSVSLFDVCITNDGAMVFSDRDNNCLRCLLGTEEDSRTITKHFKDNLQPRALAYDSCHHKVVMATDKGLYEVECSTHLSKMKEKKLNKEADLIPLSIACSTVPGSKKKGASCLLYMTIWPRFGDNCVYRFDASGHFESKICSADFSNKKPFGIDYMKEYLVVSFLDDGSLMKMSHRGDPLWDASVDARKSGILNQPFGVAILPRTEYIAVTEAGAHRVSIFSDQGKLLLRIGKKGSDRGMFNTPHGIAVRMFRELVVVDCANKRIQIFSLASLGLPSFRSTTLQSSSLYGSYAVK